MFHFGLTTVTISALLVLMVNSKRVPSSNKPLASHIWSLDLIVQCPIVWSAFAGSEMPTRRAGAETASRSRGRRAAGSLNFIAGDTYGDELQCNTARKSESNKDKINTL